MKNFQKISGYKVISKCRNCGARIVGKSESYYCDTCLAKLRKYRAEEEVRVEAEKVAKADKIAKAEKAVVAAKALKAAKKAAPKKVALKKAVKR